MRKPMAAGNWKMNHGRAKTRAVLEALKASVGHTSSKEVVIAAPFTSLDMAVQTVRGSAIQIAAQNMHEAEKGAYTGEISASMLKEAGVAYVILGHSERRNVFGEQDARINAKVKTALGAGLSVILCIGELLSEREAGKTMDVVSGQVRAGLSGVSAQEMRDIVLAYEPVWAIGTGKTATPTQAQEVHASLRGVLSSLFGDQVAQDTRILYGGSVKPANAQELFAQEDIDGGLVGGASLDADSFSAIVRA